MLAVGELPKVLEQLKASKEIYEMSIEMSQGLDPVALYLYDDAKSPKKVTAGSSLDRDWGATLTSGTSSTPSQSSSSYSKIGSKPLQPSDKPFIIKKEKISPIVEITKSPLAEAIGPIPRVKQTTLTIWYEGRPVKLPVPETSTIARVLEEIKKQLPIDVDSYQIYMAEADGTPDDDLALGLENPIRNIGKTYVLQPLRSTDRHGSISMTPNTKRLLKVNLPGTQYIMIAFQPEMTIRVLLRKVCEKRQLDTVNHFLHLVDNPQHLPANVTLRSLDIREITLAKGEISKEEEKKDTTGPLKFYSEAEAFRYKPFHVTKIKKFGAKQERILGIDSDSITNASPNPKKRQTKRPTRRMEEVKEAALAPSKPKQFILEYRKDNKSYLYEAKTAQDAREIVGKIQYCVARLNGS